MKLSTNSLNAQLYCWFYGQRSRNLPSNLCPYFWKLVLAWILVIPYGIFTLPSILLFELFSKDYKNGDKKTGERFAISLAIYIGLFLLLCMISAITTMFITLHHGTLFGEIWAAGILIWVVIIAVSIFFGIKALIEYIKDGRKVYDENGYRIYSKTKEKKPRIIIEFIKAKYNSYCPKIDWTNNK
jgi:hypothetical protein